MKIEKKLTIFLLARVFPVCLASGFSVMQSTPEDCFGGVLCKRCEAKIQKEKGDFQLKDLEKFPVVPCRYNIHSGNDLEEDREYKYVFIDQNKASELLKWLNFQLNVAEKEYLYENWKKYSILSIHKRDSLASLVANLQGKNSFLVEYIYPEIYSERSINVELPARRFEILKSMIFPPALEDEKISPQQSIKDDVQKKVILSQGKSGGYIVGKIVISLLNVIMETIRLGTEVIRLGEKVMDVPEVIGLIKGKMEMNARGWWQRGLVVSNKFVETVKNTKGAMGSVLLNVVKTVWNSEKGWLPFLKK